LDYAQQDKIKVSNQLEDFRIDMNCMTEKLEQVVTKCEELKSENQYLVAKL
jgi:hypothetical protein